MECCTNESNKAKLCVKRTGNHVHIFGLVLVKVVCPLAVTQTFAPVSFIYVAICIVVLSRAVFEVVYPESFVLGAIRVDELALVCDRKMGAVEVITVL